MTKDPGFKLSIVFPCHNEEENIGPLLQTVEAELGHFDLEIIFVDDGSTDGTLELLRHVCRNDARLKYASFSRNFGHQQALRCGLKLSTGDCTVVMDSDLQHPVPVVKELVALWQKGFKIVRTIRLYTEDASMLKRNTSRAFYWLIGRLGLKTLKPGMADFFLIDRQIVELLTERFGETTPFFRGLLSWMGFKSAEVPYVAARRLGGQSKYNFWNMLRFGVTGVIAFSTVPLRLSVYLGALFLAFSGFYGAYILIIHLILGTTVAGWSSLMLVTLLANGTTLMSIGVLGQYIGVCHSEIKSRPPYLIEESSDNI